MKSSRGFTLIELIAVIAIIAVLSGFAAWRVDAVTTRRQKGEIRKLLAVWEQLYQESVARGTAYRLVIDIDDNSYFVRQEVMPEGIQIRQVDLLKGLRTNKERARRKRSEQEDLNTIDEEFALEAQREQQGLESLFYQSLYIDPSSAKLIQPLEFPSLGANQELGDLVKILDVVLEEGPVDKGQVSIRFSPRGGSDFATIHFQINDQVITVVLNPWTGKPLTTTKTIEYDWTRRSLESEG